ncbi:glutathione transferase [Epithele typhae]|uniref:glutathione transferase n=1 Tax=Epithele typhae TaxID=378194 RepID=UPI0020073C4F|nr:glutathione transferase [Epithele typhae]KAH9926287.1 glutathione transferase [Epithele typhae]
MATSKLTLHGFPRTPCTKIARIVLEELGVPYDLVRVDFLGYEHHSAAYRTQQPFGQVPYLVESSGADGGDDFVLFECRAIARYAAILYGGVEKGLVPDPADARAVARFEQAASVEVTDFMPSARTLLLENVVKPIRGLERDPKKVAECETLLQAKLDGYEAMLSKSKYLAGHHLTIVDLFHVGYGAPLKMQGYDYLESPRWPNVARWWKDISSRQSWSNVNVSD